MYDSDVNAFCSLEKNLQEDWTKFKACLKKVHETLTLRVHCEIKT